MAAAERRNFDFEISVSPALTGLDPDTGEFYTSKPVAWRDTIAGSRYGNYILMAEPGDIEAVLNELEANRNAALEEIRWTAASSSR